jgi:hypothetical protein
MHSTTTGFDDKCGRQQKKKHKIAFDNEYKSSDDRQEEEGDCCDNGRGSAPSSAHHSVLSSLSSSAAFLTSGSFKTNLLLAAARAAADWPQEVVHWAEAEHGRLWGTTNARSSLPSSAAGDHWHHSNTTSSSFSSTSSSSSSEVHLELAVDFLCACADTFPLLDDEDEILIASGDIARAAISMASLLHAPPPLTPSTSAPAVEKKKKKNKNSSLQVTTAYVALCKVGLSCVKKLNAILTRDGNRRGGCVDSRAVSVQAASRDLVTQWLSLLRSVAPFVPRKAFTAKEVKSMDRLAATTA